MDCENNSESNQARGLVSHDRSKGLLFPYLHFSAGLEVPDVCCRGQSIPIPVRLNINPLHFHEMHGCRSGSSKTPGHPSSQFLYDWLILAWKHGIDHIKCLGSRLNGNKICSLQFRGRLFWESVMMRAQLSLAHIESIMAAVTRIKLGQFITVKQFQRLLGLMAAVSNVIHFRLLYMKPLQCWLSTRGFPQWVINLTQSSSCTFLNQVDEALDGNKLTC